MFNKWVAQEEEHKEEGNGKKEESSQDQAASPSPAAPPAREMKKKEMNTILKGSKLTGDINVTCDMILSGDVEGNIRSSEDSNIVIKGTCAGNIETKGGSVDLDGVQKSGDIIAGSNVKITGTFHGGEVRAAGKIYVDGEFSGKLQGKEVEIGSNARGKGEIFYGEFISVSRGAKVEINIVRMQEEVKGGKKSGDAKVVDLKAASREKSEPAAKE